MEIGQRTENENEMDKKDERNQKAKMYPLAHLSGYHPLTLPLEVYEGYHINKRRNWTKEACVNPLVKRSLSWFLV